MLDAKAPAKRFTINSFNFSFSSSRLKILFFCLFHNFRSPLWLVSKFTCHLKKAATSFSANRFRTGLWTRKLTLQQGQLSVRLTHVSHTESWNIKALKTSDLDCGYCHLFISMYETSTTYPLCETTRCFVLMNKWCSWVQSAFTHNPLKIVNIVRGAKMGRSLQSWVDR